MTDIRFGTLVFLRSRWPFWFWGQWLNGQTTMNRTFTEGYFHFNILRILFVSYIPYKLIRSCLTLLHRWMWFQHTSWQLDVKFKTWPLFRTCIFIVVTFILLHILPSVKKLHKNGDAFFCKVAGVIFHMTINCIYYGL